MSSSLTFPVHQTILGRLRVEINIVLEWKVSKNLSPMSPLSKKLLKDVLHQNKGVNQEIN